MVKKIIISLVVLLSISQLICSGNNYTNTPGYYEAKFTKTIPVIDGIGNDTCWDKADWAPIDQVWIGSSVTESDFSGKFKMMWTKDRLYLLVRIIDDSLRLQAPNVSNVCNNIYNYDCVELFIDENNSRETNYSGTFKAVAYHLDTIGNICYSMGNSGWVRLDDHIHYKMKRVDTHTFDYEYEIKVFNDTYTIGGNNTPVELSNGKLMGWSIAYNDNDLGSTRQNMIGSINIVGADKNVSYYNSSVFGELKLVGGNTTTSINSSDLKESHNVEVRTTGDKLQVTYSNNNINEDINIQLFDMNGRQVFNLTTFKPGRSITKEYNICGIAKGVYVVKVTEKDTTESKKIYID